VDPSRNAYSFVGYFQSWSDPWSATPAVNNLANIPSYVNYVILSFMRPDSTYTGGVTFAGTGLDFSSDAAVIKAAIALLKSRNPNTKVLVAVGGATYTSFNNLNAAAVAQFVNAFGLDGVDLDYEPTNPNCSNFGPNLSCTTDTEYINSVKALRTALPRPLLLTTAAWSTGAYGQGDWIGAQPAGQYSGVAVNMLKSVGNMLDTVNIMAYDAGITYDPKQAFLAYASLYDASKLTIGLEVAPEAWGGHVISLPEVTDLTTFLKNQNGAGMMMWSLQKQAGTGPTGQAIASTACLVLGSSQCSCPLLSTQQC
jgi:chitinase